MAKARPVEGTTPLEHAFGEGVGLLLLGGALLRRITEQAHAEGRSVAEVLADALDVYERARGER